MVITLEPLCQFSDRLYFTTFPSPGPDPHALNRFAAEKGNAPRVQSRPRAGPSATPDDDATYYYFTIDDQLRYLSFFQDWGPLNIAMVYRACILIHELLEDEALASHRLVLYSTDNPRQKANAALLMALYVMIVQRRAPWEAFHPIAEMELMPFRDAGRGLPDFNLNIQDCLWGMWKAMQNGLCDMNEFNVEDYEFYEKVENGDWNWITPNFIAFASPVDNSWIKREKEKGKDKENKEKEHSRASLTSTSARSESTSTSSHVALQRKLPKSFSNCLEYFERRNIKLVVRLNTQLYDKNCFLERGIRHLELYFDDGTNPTDDIVRTFIDSADRVIESGGVVAVHCKAGLGRTGTLIGAYLVWKYGFTANEAIAFMRIVRPGSVVGPQQQYMYLKQLEWVKWAAADEVRKLQAPTMDAAPLVTPATPPAESDDADAMEDVQLTPTTRIPPVTPSRHIAAAAARTKAIATPGQPRKTPTAKRVHTQETDEEDTKDVLPALGIPPVRRGTRTTVRGVGMSESRPVRVTRSTAVANAIKRSTSPSASTPQLETPTKKAPPNKVPRLGTRAAAAARAAVGGTTDGSPRTRQMPSGPSRLPMLAPSKRPLRHQVTASMEVPRRLDEVIPMRKMDSTADDAWMTNNAESVVVPASKSARPGLRPIRRRRSSFSAADVEA